MKPKISVFIATSLDGYIARKDGSIDWLMEANSLASPGEDCGYRSFIATIDTIIMGRYSYEKVITFDEWPYGSLPVIVMSSKPIQVPEHLQHIISVSNQSPSDLVSELAHHGIQHVYLDGGITIQRFLQNNLIDEIIITLIPVLIGSGRPLFGFLENDIKPKHLSTTSYPGGFVQIKYRIGK
ncbi:TPA: dihydrofolate reductase family protein [Legionella pneumophila]|uniref:dihydrofolate reductase family protein n=1 Tax=Legionella pneumophila TaxID=446 RepID=UPI0007891EAF|nr:dihydrofolate reductase family protein [Legionella pneumophila]HAT1658034.1 dihydrofolate reductase [Legionella pneumophila]HAT1881684.1 dihydrofolate reductase [Legionella pneumophila]HAT2113592.1 dihydrofolate reductase [Legionella pneumophila]HAT8125103.1 dihydrofolate reductase [Legionella pneumophila]HAT8719408.1 dihydrofolate reductase [Legionella pneumophila]